MIKYSLVCERDHEFESWFKDSGAFEALTAGDGLSCPRCGSVHVRKALMAPSVRRRGEQQSLTTVKADDVADLATSTRSPSMEGPTDEREHTMRDAMRALHRKMMAMSDDVGRAFPEEARRIHEGEKPARAIRGEATPDEVRSLLDDGIDLLPIPASPDKHH